MKNPPSRTSAFTLVELLVVIAIIGVLASMVLAAAGFAQKKGARSRAEAEIAAIGAALESYKVDNGDYPINTNVNYNNPTSNSNMVAALMPTNGGGKVYFEFKAKSLTNSSYPGSYTDPFGYPYGYNYTNGSVNNGTNNYDLWSTVGGANTSSNSWIKNW